MPELTRERLGALRVQAKELLAADRREVLVCAGTGCIAGGSLKIYDYLKSECEKRGLKTRVALRHEGGDDAIHFKKSGCHGFCEMGPLLQIEPEGFLYTHVKLEDCDEIIERTILGGEAVERLLYELNGVRYAKHNEIPFYAKQQRVVLENCGTTDAEDIDEYLAHDGYAAFEKALFEMSDEDICREILDSGLRGRGGAGFPAGRKWDSVRRQPKGKKYVVCNGDEGDPGAFMDRSIMEGNPHSVIEGMMIAALAAGSDEGYIYVRAEYPLAVERLRIAIAKDEELGLLGDNILGTDFSFHLHINRGAGAFVCGEGSALTASIEGKRGMPRVKPPRTVEQGLWARPTVLNNVETYANVPQIILRGSAWFHSIGTEKSPGTKAFALTGNVVNTGLIEVPMGATLREIIFDIGGGIKNGKAFKAVQIGGPSGGLLSAEQLDLPLHFQQLKPYGIRRGDSVITVLDEDRCMVDVACRFMQYTQTEFCGKCVSCREGTKRMNELLWALRNYRLSEEDFSLLMDLGEMISVTAFCNLGRGSFSTLQSAVKYFPEEFRGHLAGRCALCESDHRYPIQPGDLPYNRICLVVDPAICRGCSKCARNCHANAITGVVRSPFSIDPEKCVKCYTCIEACPFDAIKEVELDV